MKWGRMQELIGRAKVNRMVGEHYSNLVHLRIPVYKPGVQTLDKIACSNGSAHLRTTTEKSEVTCPLCLKKLG